jgi:PDZ domain-containing protein
VRRLVTPVRLVIVGLCLLVVTFALWALPSDQYIFLPDPAHPVAPLVEAQGGADPNGDGGIYFVDVVYRKATLLERLLGGMHEGADLREPEQVIPHGQSAAEQRRADLAEMRLSQRIAAAVALRSLGRPVTTEPTGARVSIVAPNAPAHGRLAAADVLVAVDGARVRSPADVTERMREVEVGETVSFDVLRGGDRKTVRVKTVASPEEPGRAIVGIVLTQATDIRLPIRVSIDAGNVGGPSAGLAFALGLMEELGEDVDRGHKVAATGELFLDGQVGPIGGVKQKTIGARRAGVDAFLVPAGANAREARKYAEGLRIIPVKNFQQALRALATLPESA